MICDFFRHFITVCKHITAVSITGSVNRFAVVSGNIVGRAVSIVTVNKGGILGSGRSAAAGGETEGRPDGQ